MIRHKYDGRQIISDFKNNKQECSKKNYNIGNDIKSGKRIWYIQART